MVRMFKRSAARCVEYPVWRRTSHRPDKDVVLQPGMGVCVEIHPCSADVIRGVFLGDTFVITEDGARCVNKLEAKLYEL